jgi:hypothetical protein
MPVLNAVVIWAEKHLPAPSEAAHMYVIHSRCGHRTSSADTCLECGERLTADNTSWHSLTRTGAPVQLATAPDSDQDPTEHEQAEHEQAGHEQTERAATEATGRKGTAA